MPPLFGSFPSVNDWSLVSAQGGGGSYGTIMFNLLPFIEQDNLFKGTLIPYGSGKYHEWSASVNGTPAYNYVIKPYLNPSDPSGTANQYQGIAHSGYAANAQVFAVVRSDGRLVAYGDGAGPNGVASLTRSFSDGTSNTILFGEKYSRCDLTRAPAYDWNGTWWNYGWCNDATWYLGSPFFACDYYGTYPNAIGPGSVFQVTPTPFDGPACDPARLQAPRPGGLLVVLGDASVRMISPGISGTTWWAACTPQKGEVLGADWSQ
jgi:hypothetical protein